MVLRSGFLVVRVIPYFDMPRQFRITSPYDNIVSTAFIIIPLSMLKTEIVFVSFYLLWTQLYKVVYFKSIHCIIAAKCLLLISLLTLYGPL